MVRPPACLHAHPFAFPSWDRALNFVHVLAGPEASQMAILMFL